MPRRALIDDADPLHAKTDKAWDALVAANDPDQPEMLVRGNKLVRMTKRGELEDFNFDSLLEHLSRVTQFFKTNANGQQVDIDPPMPVVRLLLARDAWQYAGAPEVDRVVDVPVVGASGKLITKPGHNPSDNIYYRPDEKLGVMAPWATDTPEDVQRAREYLLYDLLRDFDFADEASRAHALGLLLLPFVREFIDGPTPMHVVFAPEHGAGKTTLVRAVLMPGCGEVAMNPGAGKNDEEWRKQITTLLLAGVPAIVFDNLAGVLNTPALANALTSGTWTDRILGGNERAVLPVRNAWVATGNNLDLSEEHARRVVPIFLDPKDKVASQKPLSEFRHPNLLKWAKNSRKDLANAALTLVDHWLQGPTALDSDGHYAREEDARPMAWQDKTLASYTEYCYAIGGLLEQSGVTGFLGNLDRLHEQANEGSEETTDFLRTWGEQKIEPMKVKALAELIYTPNEVGNALRGALPTELSGVPDRLFATELAYWLRRHNNQKRGGYQLVKEQGRRAKWKVVPRTLVP